MTTAHSPRHVLKPQAVKIADALKAAERGEKIAFDPGGKIAAARGRESVKFVIAMDDKLLNIEMAWAMIGDLSAKDLAEFILEQMTKAAP